MPEIGEVARIVHYIRKNLVGKKLKTVVATADDIVYGKVGTSASEIEKHLKGKKVVDVGQQGKYFWMVMSSPPHPLMHFGMAGWMKFHGEHTFYYRPKPGEDDKEWPPKYWKFHIETEPEGKDGKTAKAAFVDKRRLARVRLIDCDAKDIRKTDPLNKNGPDPVIDKDTVTLKWLTDLCRRKKVPIKAMLLDQANISGIGNWVGDEVLYHAKIHPEQYANTLQDGQIAKLHENIHYVCDTACELLAETDSFPENWLFKYRWDKGKKGSTHTLPSGEKIVFLTVGGRTSAVVPSVQKKTGPVAKDVDDDDDDDDNDGDANDIDMKDEDNEKETKKPKKQAATKSSTTKKRKIEKSDESEEEDEAPTPKKPARGKKPETNGVAQDKSKAKAKPKAELKTETKTKTESKANGVEKAEKQPAAKKAKKAEVKAEESAEKVTLKVSKARKLSALPSYGAVGTRRRSARFQK